MPEAPPTPPASRLGRESAAVAAGSCALALGVLRARPDWARGVIGDHDAWQNLWNLHHVDAALRNGSGLWRSCQVWAPEGTSLLAHTLSPTNTVPGALLARLTGFFLSYNLLVVASFVLAATAFYRLARRLPSRPGAAALGALVFAFCPPRMARALGHLNLLGIGWIPLALEALLVAARARGARRLLPAAGAATALVALVFSDWYLSLLGLLAVGAFALVSLARDGEGRAGRLAVFGLTAALALAPTLPAALALARERSGHLDDGHESKWCSVAVTSLVVPSRMQLVAALTRPLTERNHQNLAEGPAYLGLVPLVLTGLALSRRPRSTLFLSALAAGGVALVLSLGPQPRLFDRLLDVPLPYAWLERAVPALRLGGCVNRLVALAYLPLGLGAALAADAWLASSRRRAAAATAAAFVLLAIEYAPIDPGVSVWPLTPPDPAMVAIAASPTPGAVLDVDGGIAGLIRQLRHGRAQTLGYLARTPPGSWRARLADPVLGPAVGADRPPLPLPAAARAELLRSRWGVAFVVTPDVEPYRTRAAALGFPRFAWSEGLSVVYRVPQEPLPPLERLAVTDTADDGPGPPLGLFAWGFRPPEEVGADGRTFRGRWTTEEGGTLLAPLAPGRYRLVVTLPRPGPVRVRLTWGKRVTERTIRGTEALPVEVRPDDLRAGALTLHVDAWPKLEGQLGVFVVALERE